MSDDCTLLSEICEAHRITASRLARLSGWSPSHIYRMLSGERTIPSLIWRIVYELSRDARIPQLVTGETPTLVIHLPKMRPAADAANLRRLIELRHQQLEFERLILEMIADGRVDHLDQERVMELKIRWPAMVQSLGQIYQTIVQEYERSTRTVVREMNMEGA